MAKRVANAVGVVQCQRFGMDKKVRFVGCDDGCTYVFVRPADGRRWRPRERIDADGDRSAEPSRLPLAVEAHMDGVTKSGPEGPDGQEYLA
jgi:hypothetical protein